MNKKLAALSFWLVGAAFTAALAQVPNVGSGTPNTPPGEITGSGTVDHLASVGPSATQVQDSSSCATACTVAAPLIVNSLAITSGTIPASNVSITNRTGSALDFNIAGTNYIEMLTNQLYPNANNSMALGASGRTWSNLYITLANSSSIQSGTVCYTSSNTINYDSSTTCLLSSRKFKKNIQPITNALPKIMAMQPVWFEYKDHKGTRAGQVAEDVAEIEPRLVDYDDEGKPLKIKYFDEISLLMAAVQEQQKEIERLKIKLKNRK